MQCNVDFRMNGEERVADFWLWYMKGWLLPLVHIQKTDSYSIRLFFAISYSFPMSCEENKHISHLCILGENRSLECN